MDEFINSFIDESGELLSFLEKDLLQLEQQPENDELINNIFRVMHTLKGAARMYGFDNMEALAHEFETLYDQIRNHKLQLTADIIDATLAGKDALMKMLSKGYSSEKEEELRNTISRLIPKDEAVTEKLPLGNKKPAVAKAKNFCVLFYPDMGVFERGLNPDSLLDDIQDIGEPNITMHEQEDSWKKQRSKKICKTSWEIYVKTYSSFDEIKDLFLFYDEEEYFILEILDKSSFANPLLKKFFKKHYPKGTAISKHINSRLAKISVLQKEVSKEKKDPDRVNEDEESPEKKSDDSSNPETNSTINVSSGKIDELMNLVSGLVSSTAELKALSEKYKDFKLNNAIENIEKLTKRFRNNALDLRLVPVGTLLNRFRRHVRDLSKELNKKVNLIIDGQETEIDKMILKAIENPLLHIIRNGIDHGIESPEERLQKNKPKEGMLKISAFYSGANVVIQIQDDGQGIDLEKVRELAIKNNFIPSDQQISDQALLSVIMEPGFTTSDKVSKLSGRGVGMDIVRKELNAVSGSLEIETEKGLGTSITMKLPATLSIIDTLMIEVNQSRLLLPMIEIEYCFVEEKANLDKKDNNYIEYKNDLLPYISLREKFNYPRSDSANEMVIIINKYNKKYGIVVDGIIGEHQAVIKPLGELFANQPYFSGGSLMVDGKLALILDTNYLLNQLVMN